DSGSRLDLDRAFIAFNEAEQGGGIYADNAAEISLHSDGPCAGSIAEWCSVLGLNESPLGGGLAVSNGASAVLELTLVARNGPGAGQAGDAPIATVDTAGSLVLKGSVVSSNSPDVGTASGGIVDTGGFVSVDGTTFWNNLGSDHLFWVGGSFAGQSSIFEIGAGAGDLFNVQTAGSWSLDCALIAPGLSLPAGGTNITIGDALLKDPAGIDFHLSAGSPAIDLCPGTVPGLAMDFDLDSRPLGAAPDAGADEYVPPLFADGFESGDTVAWGG
ncbi:MAG: hypothetical protein K8J08_03905, partial [Thermoanaerobaculia bacterium]|nr:hypothetical protein [Thermoanaerobaculia bacterium]